MSQSDSYPVNENQIVHPQLLRESASSAIWETIQFIIRKWTNMGKIDEKPSIYIDEDLDGQLHVLMFTRLIPLDFKDMNWGYTKNMKLDHIEPTVRTIAQLIVDRDNAIADDDPSGIFDTLIHARENIYPWQIKMFQKVAPRRFPEINFLWHITHVDTRMIDRLLEEGYADYSKRQRKAERERLSID